MEYIITSNDDESVTLKCGSITARIEGDSWRDANRTAHLLAEMLMGNRKVYETLRSVVKMSDDIGDIKNEVSLLKAKLADITNDIEQVGEITGGKS
jgi:hypothetical protein